MIQQTDYHNAHAWLAACRRPLLVSHRRPDGDAIGALGALALALHGAGCDPRPALFEPLPARYALLAEIVNWRRWDLERAALEADADALVILDTCSRSQLDPLADYLDRAPRTLVIDHHPTRDPIGTRAGDLQLIDESAAAVCLMIAEWAVANRVVVTPPIAKALLVGLGTDSGWFRFSNADARVLRVAADLAGCGVSLHDTYRAVYEREPLPRLKLVARVLDSLELHAGGALAVMKLRQADFAAANADRTMTEDLVNEAGRLAGIEALVLFVEEPDGSVRVNLRSKERLEVSRIAQQFGGGGHARASGARPAGKWDDVVSRVTQAVVDALTASP